jgi:hypothetical protein
VSLVALLSGGSASNAAREARMASVCRAAQPTMA